MRLLFPQIAALLLMAAGTHGLHADAPVTNAAPAPAPQVDPAKKRLAMLQNQPLTAVRIFSQDTFPKIDFLNRDLVEAAVGKYSLQVRFFDAQWNEVTAPKSPGRYGAVVDCSTVEGIAFTRHLTLFRTALPYRWAKETYNVSVEFPAAFAVPADELASEQWIITNSIAGTIGSAEHTDDHPATLLAVLQTITADPRRWHGFNTSFIDNAWWSELGRRLGENQDYPHLTYRPADYDADPQKRWPLILFLHGSGERGHDLKRLEGQGPQGFINAGHSLPFVVVSPQCPEDERWDNVRLARLLDEIEAAERVDPKRIYVTGLSMGGYGTIDFAAEHGDRVAAIAPLSGGETPALAPRLQEMPAWFFHGAEDDTVPLRYSVDLVDALQKLRAPVKLTVYPGVGHGGWNVTYRDPDLYTWFLAHTK